MHVSACFCFIYLHHIAGSYLSPKPFNLLINSSAYISEWWVHFVLGIVLDAGYNQSCTYLILFLRDFYSPGELVKTHRTTTFSWMLVWNVLREQKRERYICKETMSKLSLEFILELTGRGKCSQSTKLWVRAWT